MTTYPDYPTAYSYPQNLTTEKRLEAAGRLIRSVTGERGGDGEIVFDLGVGIVDGDPEAVWARGNWNNQNENNLPSRLLDALERLGVECEWFDEWSRCDECQWLVRMQPDSYHWTPQSAYTEAGDLYCSSCLEEMGEGALEATNLINNPDNALTWAGPDFLSDLGFEVFEEGTGQFESGWFPGQDDKPALILQRIQARYPDSETVFILDENSQFYMKFSAYVRLPILEG